MYQYVRMLKQRNLDISASHEHAKILVVDDDLLSQKMISTMPAKLGYQSDVAGNGLEALHLLSGRQYDLVLMN